MDSRCSHYRPEPSKLRCALLNKQGNLQINISPAFETDLASCSSILTETQERSLHLITNRIGTLLRNRLTQIKSPSIATTVVVVSGHPKGQEAKGNAQLGEDERTGSVLTEKMIVMR